MTFVDMLNNHKAAVDLFNEIAKRRALEIVRRDGRLKFQINSLGLSPTSSALLKKLDRDMSSILETFIIGRAVADGPKIFRPGRVDLELLEKMRLSIPFSEYRQPFPTMVVQLPPDYVKGKVVHCPQEGELHGGAAAPPEHEPCFAVVHHEERLDVICMVPNPPTPCTPRPRARRAQGSATTCSACRPAGTSSCLSESTCAAAIGTTSPPCSQPLRSRRSERCYWGPGCPRPSGSLTDRSQSRSWGPGGRPWCCRTQAAGAARGMTRGAGSSPEPRPFNSYPS